MSAWHAPQGREDPPPPHSLAVIPQNLRKRRSRDRSSTPLRLRTHPRGARAPPRRRRAAAAPAALPLPCRASRPPAENVPGSRVELLLLARGLGKPVAGFDELGLR